MENKDRDFFEKENENNDLFSYDNSANAVNEGENSFDLNSFSSHQSNNGGDSKNGKKKGKKGKTKQRVLKVFLSLFLVGLITVCLVVASFMFYAFTMVDGTMEEDLENSLNFTTTVYIDDGEGNYTEYRRLHAEYNRIWVDYLNPDNVELPDDYEGIPQTLANAFVAIEDRRFFEHEGVDWKRTMGAFINEFVPIYSSRQGGSTITQQLVKNLTDDRSQKASRKVREIMRARYLESKYAKDTILECYLNTIPLDHGIYGVEVAANYYFGKNVKDLTLVECAAIAAITKSPTYYSPDDNPENNRERRNTVLYEMYTQGYITKDEYDEAVDTELDVVSEEGVLNRGSINSYFIDALISQVSKDLAEKYGYDKAHADNLFYNNGYKIYATLDPDMQEAAEKVFKDSDTYAIKNKQGQYMTGGITVMDYEGHIKAIVGSIGEKTTNRGFNCATDAVRQPGSTMKPIAAYAPAIEQDLITYSSLVNDTKTNYKNWYPKNWYNSFWGNITVQYALERSVNTIPVYLVNKLTPQTSYDFLTQKLGITTLNAEDINLSPLGMGGTNGGLTTVESAAAFAVFGNGGLYYEPTFYTKVTDQKGTVILEHNSQPQMAISEDTATIMNHLLQTVVYGSNGTGTRAKSYIKNMKIYAKTGTSNNQNDLWFVGGTPYYVASCWCGYEEMQAIPSAYSGIALTMWGNVMSEIHSGLKAKEFTDSDYTVDKYYCASTGKLATKACPSKAVGWYKKSNVPGACTSHSGELLGKPGSEPVEDKDKDKDTSSNQSSSSQSQTESSENQSSTGSGTENTETAQSDTQEE
ncbi:MAG: penicillin-binding protein [Clostridia bacterium]|nr:penicillin-binding protein [Clostridia bacterium]